MDVKLILPARTWAALDAALAFFRTAPGDVSSAQRLRRHCCVLHNLLQRLGLRSSYVRVGSVAPGRELFRLRVRGDHGPLHPLELCLNESVARSLAVACLTIIEVQTDAELGRLLDHEAEELLAARHFLSELRKTSARKIIPLRRARGLIVWDERRREYLFTAQAAWRVQEHFLRAGASPN
ncbi:MAG: hypothetical protein NZM31_07145 [Gemmatales bacterium]|nr:hypothetical protein [Gemmatales bacterium]MDW8386776.1 hypothetical protein [Gemmatales bacterium]